MKNLKYFCHYHCGTPRDKSVKIAGSFLILSALLTWTFSVAIGSAAGQQANFLAQLLPEPGYLIATVEGAPVVEQPAQTVQPVVPAPQPAPVLEVAPTPVPGPAPVPASAPQTCRVNGVERPGPCSNYPSQGEMRDAGPGMQEKDDDQREQFERQMVINQKQEVLRQIVQQKRELNRLRSQLRRLRGAADDLAQADTLMSSIADFENRIRSNSGEDFDELRSAIEEYHDAQLWEEVQKVRLKVELPRELNRLLADINRITRLLSQRAFQNLGFDVATVKAKVDAIKALHVEVRACYQSGDFECANEKMQEIREGDHPGELQGAMQMLRGIKEMSKMVRDKELKAEIEELVQPVIQSINSGEWRQAREDMQEIEKELRDIMQRILTSQRQRRGPSEDVRARLERMRQKFEQEAPAGQDNVEEDMMPGLPSSGSGGGGGGSVIQPVTPLQQPAP